MNSRMNSRVKRYGYIALLCITSTVLFSTHFNLVNILIGLFIGPGFLPFIPYQQGGQGPPGPPGPNVQYWAAIKSRPFVVVSPVGGFYPNNGANYGPDDNDETAGFQTWVNQLVYTGG